MVLVQFIWHDVGFLSCDLVYVLVLFANNGRPGVQLRQVIHNRVLNVNIDLCEDICSALSLLHSDIGKAGYFSYAMYDFVGAFQ